MTGFKVGSVFIKGRLSWLSYEDVKLIRRADMFPVRLQLYQAYLGQEC